jgi:tetrahydromethanopterin S-methyltransferase subunit G
MAKEWEFIKKRVDEIDKKAAFAADLTKVTVYSSYFLK